MLCAEGKRTGKSAAGQIPAQTSELALVGGENQGSPAGRQQSGHTATEGKRIGIQNKRAFCGTDDFRNDRFRIISEPQAGANDAGARPLQKREKPVQGMH